MSDQHQRRRAALHDARLEHKDTGFERWVFGADDRAFRMAWPSADCALHLKAMCHDRPLDLDPRLVAAVLQAYAWLARHPLGAERAVEIVRALHRAERLQARKGKETSTQRNH